MPPRSAAAVDATASVRKHGGACFAAGLLGAVGSGHLALMTPVPGLGGFTFPHGAAELIGVQMLAALSKLGLISGLVGLRRSGAVPATRPARLAHRVGVLMLSVITVAEGVALSVPRSVDDGRPPVLGVISAVYTLVLGVSLLVEGAAVARTDKSPTRWLPLALGAWLIMVSLPAAAVSFDAARWSTAAWMLLVAALGWALLRRHDSVPPAPRTLASRAAGTTAVATWVYAVAFGSPTILNGAYLLQNGRLPSFLGLFTSYGGPWQSAFPDRLFVIPLGAFFLLTVAAAWAAWLVWHGSKLGGVLTAVLLPIEAVFWVGFDLPFPWLLGAVRAISLIIAWRSLHWPGRRRSGLVEI